ncbi:hypothetical protein FRB90_003707 [Tulasnella sp. 427]|nr:hypothetical protein FRB90_003707 [Tulasnella sp. 427]
MHRALYVCELLRTIFDSLIAHNAERSTLSAALATTIWLEPALDSLWRNLDDFKILLKLWPTDALTRDSATRSYYRFIRPLTPSDWERFDFYGKRVRGLSTSLGRPRESFEGRLDLLHDTFCTDLGKSMAEAGRTVLLPNLLSLELQGSVCSTTQLGSLLITSRLEKLHVSPDTSEMHCADHSFLRAIILRKPAFRSVALPNVRVSAYYPCGSTVLATAYPPSIESAVLPDDLFKVKFIASHLSSLPRLEKLRLTSYYSMGPDYVHDAIRPMLALRSLTAGRGTVQRLARHAPNLTSVMISTLYDYDAATEEEMQPSVEAFMQTVDALKASCKNLRELKVVWDKDDELEEEVATCIRDLPLCWGSCREWRRIVVQVEEMGEAE